MDGFYEKAQQSAEYILSHSTLRPTCGIVLGSGLGSLVDRMTDKTIIPYADIPHFPRSTVAGHASNLVLGTLAGQTVAALQGRFHYYEGFTMRQVTYPVYVFRLLGVRTLVITNACGGIDRGLAPGELMLLSDYINMLGSNSLMGPNDERFGPRFPDMTEPYSLELREQNALIYVEFSLPVSILNDSIRNRLSELFRLADMVTFAEANGRIRISFSVANVWKA